MKIFETIAAIERGVVHPAIGDFGRELILRIGEGGNGESLRRYALLHDLDKGNCLRLKLKDRAVCELSWDEWCSRLPEPKRTDPRALAEYFKVNGIEAVSYFHDEDKDHGVEKRKHGEVAAARLRDRAEGLGISQVVVTAIERHESFYQFSKVDEKAFKRRFSNISEESLAWVITASYCDAMASLNPAGEPGIGYLEPLLSTAGAVLGKLRS